MAAAQARAAAAEEALAEAAELADEASHALVRESERAEALAERVAKLEAWCRAAAAQLHALRAGPVPVPALPLPAVE